MGEPRLTAMYTWRNTVSLGFCPLESVLSTEQMADELLFCVDPDSDPETIKLVDALCNRFSHKARRIDFRWPIGSSGDGSVIGVAGSFCLANVRTEFCIDIQADEVYDPVLMATIRDNWRNWAANGYECFRFKVLNTEHNAQRFQGGEKFDGRFDTYVWDRGGLMVKMPDGTSLGGAGYNHSFKMIKKCDATRLLHDSWSFNWVGFVCKDVTESERHPIVHLHNFHRDSLIAIRRNAANNIWTDPKFGDYKVSADRVEATKDEWFNDPIWTEKVSPFDSLLPDVAKPLIGCTSYKVRWELISD